jgi:hypothetical protein
MKSDKEEIIHQDILVGMAADGGLPGPVVFVTHKVVLNSETAVKRFRSRLDHDGWLHGDEPRREWRALNLLAEYAPGLAPEPIRADLDSDPAVIVMSRLPGEPLGTCPASDAQVDAIAAALSRLHRAVPPTVLDRIEQVPGSPQFAAERARNMAAACQAESLDLLSRQGYESALAWLDSRWTDGLSADALFPVFAQYDPNLANHLWDGREVRLVDFEASGRADRVVELADFVEHITVWAHAGIDAEAFLDRFDLTAGEQQQIQLHRRLFAVFWVMRLLPSGSAHHRNPPGTLDRQATRLLNLLSS